jgi:hypothetical protein
LEKLGRKERVLELPDEMPNKGPLHDIDADGPSRAAWRKRILGAEAESLPPGVFDDVPLWRSIVARTRARRHGRDPARGKVASPPGRPVERAELSASGEVGVD